MIVRVLMTVRVPGDGGGGDGGNGQDGSEEVHFAGD